MQIIGEIPNKKYTLMVPKINLDNFEYYYDEELESQKTYFQLTERQWIDLLGLWREMNEVFQLCLDMCEEDWLQAKDIDKALELVHKYRADKNKDDDVSSEEHQHALDIVRDAFIQAKQFNTYVEFNF